MEKIPILLYHDLCSATNKAKDNFETTFQNFAVQKFANSKFHSSCLPAEEIFSWMPV